MCPDIELESFDSATAHAKIDGGSRQMWNSHEFFGYLLFHLATVLNQLLSLEGMGLPHHALSIQ